MNNTPDGQFPHEPEPTEQTGDFVRALPRPVALATQHGSIVDARNGGVGDDAANVLANTVALDAIGGFKALADYLADDYQFGNKIQKAGYRLLLSQYVVDSIQGRESIGGYFSHQLRWGRTYRACRPKGYFLSVLTKGTAFSVMFLLASGFDGPGWVVFGAGLTVRFMQAAYLEAAYVKGPGVMRYFWLLPFKDLRVRHGAE